MRKEILPIIFKQGNESYKTVTEAVVTHDGYFAVWLPSNIKISIVMGACYKWIQIESAEWITMDAFVSQNETQNTSNAWANLRFENMQPMDGNLYQLNNDKSMLTIEPLAKGNYVLRLVFRPIVKALDHMSVATV